MITEEVALLVDVVAPEDRHLVPQLLQYLSCVDESDPALLFCWDHRALRRFVFVANAHDHLPLPQWVSSAVGGMTMETLMSDVVAYVAQAGGKRFESLLVASPTSELNSRALYRIVDVERDPYVQACMHDIQLPSVLARMAQIKDRQRVVTPVFVQLPNAGAHYVDVFE
eukprot:jgi/Chlat1/1035/Chrsp109S01455